VVYSYFNDTAPELENPRMHGTFVWSYNVAHKTGYSSRCLKEEKKEQGQEQKIKKRDG